MSSLVAPKPKRIQSPRTLWPDQDGENKGETELWGFSEDASLEVKRIWVSEEFLESDVPIRRSTPKLRESFAGEPFSPTRNPSPPIRSQNPFEADETAELEAHCYGPSHEVDLILTENSPVSDDIRSPASPVDEDDHDPVVDEIDQDDDDVGYERGENGYGYGHGYGSDGDGGGDHDCYEPVPPSRPGPFPTSASFSPPEEDPTDDYLLPRETPFANDPFQGMNDTEDVAYGTHLVLQIATAPVTPCYKRKRGETISRSLPDIRFPDYLRHPVHPSYTHPPVDHHHHHHHEQQQQLHHHSYSYSSHSYHYYEPPPPAPPPPCYTHSPKRAATSSPWKSLAASNISRDIPVVHASPTVSLLTSALLNHRAKHRRCRSSQLTLVTGLTGLAENVNEIEASGGLISPSQRYRHTVS